MGRLTKIICDGPDSLAALAIKLSSRLPRSIARGIHTNNSTGRRMKQATSVTTLTRQLLGAALLVPAVLAAACGGKTEPGFTQAEAKTIREKTQAFEGAFNKKEADSLTSYHTPESVLMPPNAPTVRGKEPIKQFYGELYAQGATELEVETKDLRGHGTLAYESGSYSLNRRPAQGAKTRDRGKYLFIRSRWGQTMV